ncbi:MAG TPA: hypothetical protein VNX61_13275 [Rhizomicrobium sp.]|nr:hypothetical protein [Rhizomicrobium sp.]
MHSNATYIDVGALVFALLAYLVSLKRGKLEITTQGIGVVDWFGRWFYDWTDIERVVEIKAGVRVFLKGRSDEQNGFNYIQSFGFDPSQLSSIIADGIARFGAGSHSPVKTVAPGDDLKAARARRTKIAVCLGLLILGTPLALMTVPEVLGCLKGIDLQKHGKAARAAVIRIYTAGCGKTGGCSENVEYAFTPEPTSGGPRKEYRGYEYIGSSRSPHDPDMLYAKTYRTVPIVYDATWPEISSLNFRNRVFAQNPVTEMLRMLGIFGGLWAVIVLSLVALGAIRRAKKASG